MNRSLCNLGLLFLCSFVISCGGGGGEGASSGSSPNDRWPETGDFSYQFSFNFNGNICDTGKQAFTRKAEYCLALLDRNLNKACALEMRRKNYQNECGSDFEESNITPFSVVGYDSRLGRQCQLGSPGVERFALLRDYCAYLKNESLHASCFWDNRREEFRKSNCPGDFSKEPSSGGNQPGPTPTFTSYPIPPSPWPSPVIIPSPNPEDDRPQVVKDLEAAGIKVEVHEPTHPLPGEKPFRERLKQFWQELALVKDDFIARREQIKEISITGYVKYELIRKDLALSVDFTASQLSKYLEVLDQRIQLERESGIRFDFGIELFDNGDPNELESFLRLIDYLQSKLSSLKAMRGIVQVIKFDSSAHYWFSNRELQLRRAFFQNDFEHSSKFYVPLGPFFQWAEQNEIPVTGDYDVGVRPTEFTALITLLDQQRDKLRQLKTVVAKLTSIELMDYSSQNYFSDQGKLSPASRSPGRELIAPVLQSLLYQYVKALAFKFPIENQLGLDQNYLAVMKRLQANESVISTKKNSIKKIVLSYQTSFYGDVLTLGYVGTDQETTKIISQIP